MSTPGAYHILCKLASLYTILVIDCAAALTGATKGTIACRHVAMDQTSPVFVQESVGFHTSEESMMIGGHVVPAEMIMVVFRVVAVHAASK